MIWTITHTNRRSISADFKHLNNYWIESMERIQDSFELDLSTIDGKPPEFHLDPLISDTYSKANQIQKICDLFYSNQVQDGDIFVFTDGWNFGVIPLSYIRKQFGLKNVKFIGFLADSYFSDSPSAWVRFYKDSKAEHDWAKHFEKALLQSFDFNCFKTAERFWQYKRRYRNLVKHVEWKITGLPFEYIWKDGLTVELGRKENMVVVPWLIDDGKLAILEAMNADFPDWQFIPVIRNAVNRENYRQLLRRAKIVMSLDRHDADITILWEALCNGCHPLIPSTSALKKYFPDRYRYDAKLILFAKHLKFLRNRFHLEDVIRNIMDHYLENTDILRDDALRLKDEMFTDQPFLDILERCK